MIRDVDILIPSYNKKDSINQTLTQIENVLFQEISHYNFNLILIIDGDDGSVSLLDQNRRFPLKVIVNDENKGKGFSLKKGFNNSFSEIVVFFDADLDINPDAILLQLNKIENNQSISGAVGAKYLAESEVLYPLIRRVYSSAFRLVVKCLFSTDILDSQTGVKSFRRLDIDEILNTCYQDGFIFDLELMILLIRNGKTIEYTPVTIQHQYNSSIKFLTPLIIFFDLLELRRKISI
jgi:glycosyltransferase involved in cell wall biosynthesis